MVGILRAEAGRNPYDRGLTDLIGELSTRSDEFRTRWAAHNVRSHRTGAKKLHHPVVGDLDLTYEAMELPADPGLTLLIYTAEPGSTTQDSLNLLATWSATLDQPDEPDRPDEHDRPKESDAVRALGVTGILLTGVVLAPATGIVPPRHPYLDCRQRACLGVPRGGECGYRSDGWFG